MPKPEYHHVCVWCWPVRKEHLAASPGQVGWWAGRHPALLPSLASSCSASPPSPPPSPTAARAGSSRPSSHGWSLPNTILFCTTILALPHCTLTTATSLNWILKSPFTTFHPDMRLKILKLTGRQQLMNYFLKAWKYYFAFYLKYWKSFIW